MEEIPQLLSELPIEKRLDYLIKLMPYVLPKVEPAVMYKGEPVSYDVNDFWETSLTKTSYLKHWTGLFRWNAN